MEVSEVEIEDSSDDSDCANALPLASDDEESDDDFSKQVSSPLEGIDLT